jgi:hypothetical protein
LLEVRLFELRATLGSIARKPTTDGVGAAALSVLHMAIANTLEAGQCLNPFSHLAHRFQRRKIEQPTSPQIFKDHVRPKFGSVEIRIDHSVVAWSNT